MDSGVLAELKQRSFGVRRDVVGMLGLARADCLASSLSAVDILVWLYGSILNICPESPFAETRDRFVLGQLAATPALYAVLAERGFFRKDELWGYRRLGSMLQPFPERCRTPGVDASCVSDGMGLGISLGLALALRSARPRVFCLMGEDEMALGQVWETFFALASLPTVKLTLLVNHIFDGTGEKVSLESRFKALGYPVASADGHNMEDMDKALRSLPDSSFGILLLKTVRGKGISSIENARFEDDIPDRQTAERLLKELEDGLS